MSIHSCKTLLKGERPVRGKKNSSANVLFLFVKINNYIIKNLVKS